jgi:hypothetical protein
MYSNTVTIPSQGDRSGEPANPTADDGYRQRLVIYFLL